MVKILTFSLKTTINSTIISLEDIMKKVLKIALRVYSIFCMCVVTILLIAGIVVLINFGKITAYFLGKVVDSYNTEINMAISSFLDTSIPDNSIQFKSITTVKGGGLLAEFNVNDNLVNGVNIGDYQGLSNEELIAELGITADSIPAEFLPMLQMVKETLVLDFVDANGNQILNRTITSKEITELLQSR